MRLAVSLGSGFGGDITCADDGRGLVVSIVRVGEGVGESGVVVLEGMELTASEKPDQKARALASALVVDGKARRG